MTATKINIKNNKQIKNKKGAWKNRRHNSQKGVAEC